MSRALVLGGSSGIGAAVVTRLARRGWTVCAASRSGRAPDGAQGVVADIRAYDSVLDAFAAAADSDGVVDVVVNSAGVGFYAPLDGDFAGAWREIVETNVLGAIHVCAAVVGGGFRVEHVVHIGSLAALRPSRTPGNGVYSAAKAAAAQVVAQTRALLRERGLATRVSDVVPGFVEATGFGERFFAFAPEAARPLYAPNANLSADDVAAVVEQAILSPPHVELSGVVVRPTLQPD